MKKEFVLFIAIVGVFQLYSQSQKVFLVHKDRTVFPLAIKKDFFVNLYNLEESLPNGDSYRAFLLRQKQKSSYCSAKIR